MSEKQNQPAGPAGQFGGQPTSNDYNNYSAYPDQGPTVNISMGQPLVTNSGEPTGWGADPVGLFADKEIRRAFVSKVYSILAVQLTATAILIGLFIFNSSVKAYFSHSQGWALVGLLFMIVPYVVFICSESARRTTPNNFILLALLTAGYGFEAAVISCRYDVTTVMSAFLATGLSCCLIAIIANSKKFDITNCGWTLFFLGVGHLLITILLIPIFVLSGKAQLGSMLLAVAGALIVSLYLMFDIQLIMGGKKCELSPEEYIFGAIMLYVDIIQLFLFMLRIMSDD